MLPSTTFLGATPLPCVGERELEFLLAGAQKFHPLNHIVLRVGIAIP